MLREGGGSAKAPARYG